MAAVASANGKTGPLPVLAEDDVTSPVAPIPGHAEGPDVAAGALISGVAALGADRDGMG